MISIILGPVAKRPAHGRIDAMTFARLALELIQCWSVETTG